MSGTNELYNAPSVADYGIAGLKVLVLALFLALVWAAINKATKFNDHKKMFEEGNTPLTIARCAMTFGQATAMVSLLSTTTENPAEDFGWIIGGGLSVVTIFTLAIRPVLERVVAGHASNIHESHGVSMAVSIVQAGFYIADGLIINAALSGSAPSILIAILASIGFMAIGMAILVVVYWVISKKLGLRQKIVGDKNPSQQEKAPDGIYVPAAIVSATYLVGLGLILQEAIAGDFNGWIPGIIGVLATTLFGGVALTAVLLLVGKYIVGASVRDIASEPLPSQPQLGPESDEYTRSLKTRNLVNQAIAMASLLASIAIGASSIVV